MSFKDIAASIVAATGRVFGEDCTYTPSGGSPVSIKGVFDNAFIEVEGVMSLKPVIRINLSDLEDAPGKGDQVTINSITYDVKESQPDSHGGTTLILKKA